MTMYGWYYISLYENVLFSGSSEGHVTQMVNKEAFCVFLDLYIFILKHKISYWLIPTFKQNDALIKCLVITIISSVRKINISQQTTVSAL